MNATKISAGFVGAANMILANVGFAGNRLEELIASLNPDAAVEVSREKRESMLREVAVKLAEQRQAKGKFELEQSRLKGELTTAKTAAGKVVELSKDASKPQPTEKAKQHLVDSITRINQQLEAIEVKIAGAKTAIDFLEALVEKRADSLRSFDAEADQAKHRLLMANLRKEKATLENELHGLAGDSASNAGLGALNRAADRASRDADAMEIMTNATGTNPSSDPVMAGILDEAKSGAKKPLNDQLAALAR